MFDFDNKTKDTDGTATTTAATTSVLSTSDDITTAPTTTVQFDIEVTEPSVTTAPSSESSPSDALKYLTDAIEQTLSKNVFVYDLTAGELLAKKEGEAVIYPASITKLLTALYALDVMPADYQLTPGDELSLLLPGSSVAYIRSHHTLTIEMLVEAMLLPSGNDAAYVLAAGVARYLLNDPSLGGEEAVASFVEGLNAFAAELGCVNTHFTTPDGYAGEEHYSSTHDLILIGTEAMQNPIIAKYAKMPTDNVSYASGHTNTWTNTNQLLHKDSEYYSPLVTGLKTGSLTDYYCVYVSAEIGDTAYLIGVFGSPTKDGRYEDTHKILNALIALQNGNAPSK